MSFTFLLRIVVRTLLDGLSLVLPLPRPLGKRSSKLRILILNWRDTRHTFVGGAEVYLHELAKRWVAANAEVTIFCGNDGFSPRYETIDGIHVIRRGGLYLVYFWAMMYYVFRLRNRFDIILDCQNGLPFFSPLYSSKPVTCLVFHIHQEVIFHSLWWPLNTIVAFLERSPMRWVYQNTPILTISDSTKSELIKMGYGNNGLTVANPGVDSTRYIPGKKATTPTILFLGRLKSYKSVDVIVKALPAIVAACPKAKLIIAGDGEDRDRLEEEVCKSKVANSVIFTGKVTESEKIRLYQEAWIFVNPSLKEGWAMTNIEANACGTPVLASDVSGNRDSVHTSFSGNVLPYGDSKVWAKEITRLLQDSSARSKLESSARRWAEGFSWERSAEKALLALHENKE